MDKSASFADKDSDREPEEMDSLLDQLLDAPSPPSESPKQETVPTTGNSTASTRSAFSMFWLVLQLFTEYLYIPQLRIMISNVFKRLKGKENESTENKINLLLANDKSFRMKYKVDLRLGSGAYGIVYKVTPKLCDKELKGTLALKILCEDSMRDPQTTLNETKNNIRLCQNSSCPNVVSFFSFNEYTYQSYRYLCLEMELCDGGTLKKSEFHEPKYVTDTFRKKILEEAISGMIFIHDCGVAHWDIHGDNIFFKSPMDETVKFGDFGLTRESPSTQHLDVQALGRTLLKWVFLRESNLSGEESKISIEFLLCKIKVQKDIREILEGLTFNTMSLSEAKRKMIEIQEKDSSDGKEELVSINCASDKGSSTSNNITANSAVRKMRTVEEMLKIDPFYPKKCNGEFLQPQDLVHFIIVYPKCNYTEVEKFTSWFKCLIEKDASITFEMRLYDDEEFPSDRVPLAKEIYERAMYVLFYLTKDFHEEMYPSFVSSEGIGQTKFQQSTQIPERHVYSRLAQKQKIDCRRPIHTMPIETRNYETPSGLTTIKSIDYFDTNKNKGYLEKTLRNLGRSANMKLEERKKAMLKCLFEESDDVHNEKNDAGSSASVTQSYLQMPAASKSSDHIEKSQTGNCRKSERNEHDILKRIISLFKTETASCQRPLNIAKKCIDDQASAKDVKPYLYFLQNSGFLEVVYLTERNTDPHFKPMRALDKITDERIAELASAFSGTLKAEDMQRSAEIMKKIIQCFKNDLASSQRPLDIAKKCIDGQSTKKAVNPYLYCLESFGYLKVKYLTERRTDPRFEPTDKLNDITDDRIMELTSEVLSGVGQEDGNCIQESMTIEQTKIDLLVNDVEIWFDYLSRKLPSGNLQYFCALLLGDSTVVDSCNTKYVPDIFFQVMNSWKCKYPKVDHVKELMEVLSRLERQDLVEEMRSFSIQSFFVHTIIIEGPNVFVGNDDFRHISRSIAQRYVHVIRFLGLPQSSIDQIVLNFASNIEEQIFQALKKIKHNFPVLNRQQVCNALHYADHSDVILTLNEMWRKPI